MSLSPCACSVHTHCTFCDGKDTPQAMAEAAFQAGVRYFGLSSHSHTPLPEDEGTTLPKDMAAYRETVLRLRAEYEGRMEILLGIELDNLSDVSPAGFDYWIGSAHHLRAPGDPHTVDWDEAHLTACLEEAFAKAPIGTGPYKFAEWSKDEHVILEAYDGYFGGKPSIDKITFNIIPEVASRIAALEAGEVMFSAGIPSVEMERLNALDSINVVAHPASRVTYLSFNHLVDSPIQNLKVRQAICHAVDFDKLINGVLDGYASPLASMACPEYDGYDAAIKGFDYNPELSKQLLAEAGYPDGFAVQASYSQSSADGSDVMQFIAAQLGEVGIKVELLEQDSAQQREMIAAGTVAPLYLNALGGPYANIDLLTKLAFCTGERYSTYTNPEFDALRQKASVTVDQTERDALNSQIQQFILDDAAALILYQPSAIYAYSSKLTGWEPRADEMKLFFNCDLA